MRKLVVLGVAISLSAGGVTAQSNGKKPSKEAIDKALATAMGFQATEVGTLRACGDRYGDAYRNGAINREEHFAKLLQERGRRFDSRALDVRIDWAYRVTLRMAPPRDTCDLYLRSSDAAEVLKGNVPIER